MRSIRRGSEHISPPTWVKPQLAALVKQAPDGPDWLHEIKLDGYRMHARLDTGRVNKQTTKISLTEHIQCRGPVALVTCGNCRGLTQHGSKARGSQLG
jgi:hypothetical protein